MKGLKWISAIVASGMIMVGCTNVTQESSSQTKPEINKEMEKAEEGQEKLEEVNLDEKRLDIERQLKEAEGITQESIENMKWSPDGKCLIYATYYEQGRDDCVYLWHIEETEPRRLDPKVVGGARFAWSPNSEYVLVEGGTSQIRGITIIDRNGDPLRDEAGEIFCFGTAGYGCPHMSLEQLWSEDSTKVICAKYNWEMEVFPEVEVSGVFDIVLYDVEKRTMETLLKSTEKEYYTLEKWKDSHTISCNMYIPKGNERGDVVEVKDINIAP